MDKAGIVRLVLSHVRDAACDTVVGRAFMAAAGVAVPAPELPPGSVVHAGTYDGIAECMAQRHGVGGL